MLEKAGVNLVVADAGEQASIQSVALSGRGDATAQEENLMKLAQETGVRHGARHRHAGGPVAQWPRPRSPSW